MEKQTLLKKSNNSLKEDHYLKIYESNRFDDWDKFYLSAKSLEEVIFNKFSDNIPFMKLVGSSATGTMVRGSGDLDYAVAFKNPISNEEFLGRIKEGGLNITEVNQNKKYGYNKLCGKYHERNFVLVPMIHPNGKIETYAQDAFYHPDFINSHKLANHSKNVILMKEFFNQIGTYKEVKGIGCEMMTLYFKNFDDMLSHFANNSFLRINFSQNNHTYSTGPLIIDYPFLGGRSFTDKVTFEMYKQIQESSRDVIEDYEYLKVR